MSVILSHTEEHNGQKMEITVIYESKDNTVEEIISVTIDTPIGPVSVSDLFMDVSEMEVAINKIVDRVDWRDAHRTHLSALRDAA